MIKVIIFGTGHLSQILEESLNNKIEVIGYLDNDHTKWNNIHNGKIINNPKNINEYKYDYILIGSQYNEDIYNQLQSYRIDKKKIFQFSKYIEYNIDYVNEGIEQVLKTKSLETIVTGISYAKCGFRDEIYNKKSVNLAYGSQDLYYDYHIIKFILEKQYVKDLKEVIIGLSYYSFQYDMSLSSMKNKVVLYYKNIGLKHNIKNIDSLVDGLEETLIIGKQIFNFNNTNNNCIIKWAKIEDFKSYEKGKYQAGIDCNKSYPNTVSENIQILKNYLNILKENNIKPIIVVFPASKYYTKYFSKKIEKEFFDILNGIKREYEFQYIDYFRANLFDDGDFRDVSHLSYNGAVKFTRILNKLIT